MTAGQPPPLPVRPRPRRGETADSYLRRLAVANHLRFSHLRRYLSRPEGSYGPVDPGRLAALAGRELPAILHALPELAPTDPRPAARRYTDEDIQRSHAARRAKYAAIRGDARNGMSGRAIERKHHVGRRASRRVTATAPAKSHAHDPVAGARTPTRPDHQSGLTRRIWRLTLKGLVQARMEQRYLPRGLV
jgi:hypothetical protein